MPHRPRSIHLLNLPDELLIEIVQRLNIRELLIAGQVGLFLSYFLYRNTQQRALY